MESFHEIHLSLFIGHAAPVFFGGALAVGVVQLAPLSWANQAAPSQASDAFVALSQYLTERSDLNARLAARLQAGLQSLGSDFVAQAEALWQWVQAGNVGLGQLNERLKSEKPELAAVPGQIMQAWYMGIVGTGAQAKVVAYEFALNAQTVSDKLKPPTYAYGLPGSWASNPVTFDLKRIPVQA